MKKIIFSFVLSISLIFSSSLAQTPANPLESFMDGVGDIGQSVNNYFEGVGEDITTDILGNTGVGPIPDGEFTLPCPEEFNIIGQNTSARGFILNILNFFLSFLGILAVSMLIYAGFLYVTDAGEGGNQEKAKKTVLYAVIGIILVLASFAIVNTVIKNAVNGGSDDGSEVNISSGFAGSQNLAEQCGSDANGNGTFQQTIIKWENFAGAGFVTDYGNGILVKNAEPVTYAITIASEIINTAGEAEPVTIKSVLWNFGGGFISYEGEHYSETNTYFEDGKNLVGVIAIDTKNRKYMLTKKVLVGDGVKARFSASNFYPKSGAKISFDGSSSSAIIGTIQGYEWETNRTSPSSSGTCPGVTENKPKVHAEFFKNPNSSEPLVCDVTLTVSTNIPGVTGTKTEEITVGDGTESPNPIVNTIIIDQDPNNDNENNLFKIKTWVSDKIDFPLENFRFEAWENGILLKSQSTTFGIDPSSGSYGGSSSPSSGYRQTYSEMIFDLSEYPGDRNIIFRVIATNSYGNKGKKDTNNKKYSIPEAEKIPKEILDFTLPPAISTGESSLPNISPNTLLKESIYNFEWKINGVVESSDKAPSFNFSTPGMQKIALSVSVKPGKEANFEAIYGWSVTKNMYVGGNIGGKNGEKQNEALDFSLPAQINPGNNYTPTLSPNTYLDENIYNFEWKVFGKIISNKKNPNISFTNKGMNTVTLLVSTKSGQVPNFIPTNGWSVSKNIFVGEDNPNAPYKRLDFSTSSPLGQGSTYTPFVNPDELLISDLYDFEWKVNGQFISSDKVAALLFNTIGINTINYKVSLKPGKLKNFTPVDGWSVSKTTFIQNTNNNPPIIHTISVSPGNTGDISTIFSFYPLVSDPDGDFINYSWDFGDGIVINAKNVAHKFKTPGNYSATLSISDGVSTTEEFVNFTIVDIGEPIPKSTIEVYIRNEDSNLSKNDIGIENKQNIINEVNKLYEELEDLETSLLDQSKKCSTLEEIIKTETKSVQKELIRIKIHDCKKEEKRIKNRIEELVKKIASLEDLLKGEYVIEGTTETLFFLYGTIPAESNRAIFLEWESGDGRSLLGQNITLQYKKAGIYTVRMNVSDGINAVFDTIGIKINRKSSTISSELKPLEIPGIKTEKVKKTSSEN